MSVAPFDEIEEIPQRLLGAAADRRLLDADRLGAVAVAQALAQAHDRPFDVAERFPEADVAGVDRLAAGLLVGGKQLLARREPAGRQRSAEPPGLAAEPAEILHRVADLRQL